MEQIFREGDIVYHWGYGKGIVRRINEKLKYPLEVVFEDVRRFFFSHDGRWDIYEPPTLSHTPYDFINGGFSQRKPLRNKKDIQVIIRCGEYAVGIDSPMVELHNLWSLLNRH